MEVYQLSFDFGTDNMAFNMIETKTNNIIKWDRFSINGKTTDEMCNNLAEYLDKIDILKVESNDCLINVLLEIQPPKNIKTNKIFGELMMYFVLKKRNGSCVNEIIEFHSSKKLKYYEQMDNEEDIDLSRLKNGHYKNKMLAIEQVRRILKRNNTEWIDFFEQNTKKDDLADCFLQNLAFLKFN